MARAALDGVLWGSGGVLNASASVALVDPVRPPCGLGLDLTTPASIRQNRQGHYRTSPSSRQIQDEPVTAVPAD